MCCVYLSLGRCLLIWPVTGQSLHTLSYCNPHRGLETGHQKLKDEEQHRTERGVWGIRREMSNEIYEEENGKVEKKGLEQVREIWQPDSDGKCDYMFNFRSGFQLSKQANKQTTHMQQDVLVPLQT